MNLCRYKRLLLLLFKHLVGEEHSKGISLMQVEIRRFLFVADPSNFHPFFPDLPVSSHQAFSRVEDMPLAMMLQMTSKVLL